MGRLGLVKGLVLACVLGVSVLTGASTLKLERVICSWYGKAFHGRTMANGKPFNMYAMTAAHKTLPLGTCVLVQYKDAEVVVQITDRGPYISGRELDLSYAAADHLGIIGRGTATVTTKILGRNNCDEGRPSISNQ